MIVIPPDKKKGIFRLKISLVNLNKSKGNCRFVYTDEILTHSDK